MIIAVLIVAFVLLDLFLLVKLCERFARRLYKEHSIKKISDDLFSLSVDWLAIHHNNKRISNFFVREKMKHIAIYGMGKLGEQLYDELTQDGIIVDYAIDKNWDKIYTSIPVISPKDDFPEVDAIVVTAIAYYDEVVNEIGPKTKIKMISLAHIIDQMMISEGQNYE